MGASERLLKFWREHVNVHFFFLIVPPISALSTRLQLPIADGMASYGNGDGVAMAASNTDS